ncbi:White-brown complex protein 11 [Balamuthia mandrillaris]
MTEPILGTSDSQLSDESNHSPPDKAVLSFSSSSSSSSSEEGASSEHGEDKSPEQERIAESSSQDYYSSDEEAEEEDLGEEHDEESEEEREVQQDSENVLSTAKLFTQVSDPISLRWEKFNYFVDVKRKWWKFGKDNKQSKRKQILFDVEGAVQAGELLAIMGPSGAGKTTMLDILAKRIKGGTLTGDIFVNNERRGLRRKEFAYVQQKDLFFATTTVRETLFYAAMLQLKGMGLTVAQKKELVEVVIEEMGLGSCADTRIGNELKRGISGGEAKRTAIGAELITNPKLLFLDEPTTGLDSAVSLSLVNTLRRLAERGRTIVCTIHQPRYEIFSKFDKLLLMSEGKVVYFGSVAESIAYFSALNFKCPRFQNPADYFLDLIRVDKNDAESITSVETVRMLQEEWPRSNNRKKYFLTDGSPVSSTIDIQEDDDDEDETSSSLDSTPSHPFKKYLTHKWTEFWVLSLRTARETWRDPLLFWTTILQFLVFGFVTGFVWYQLPVDQESMRDWFGLIYFVQMTAGFPPALATVSSVPPIRPLLKREHEKKMYSSWMYYMVLTIINFPIYLVSVILYTTTMYWTVGFHNSVESFFVFFLVTWLLIDANYQLGLSAAAVSPSAEVGNIVLTIPMILWTTYSGFFILPANIPDWFIWLYWTSMYKYAFDAVVQQQFLDQTIPCNTQTCELTTESVLINGQSVNVTDLPVDSFECEVSGCLGNIDDVVELFDFSLGVWESVAVLAGIAVLLRVSSFLLLGHVSHRI